MPAAEPAHTLAGCGARLFISPRTAAYHLSNVFTKLGIGSRSQLYRELPAGPGTARPR